MKIKPGTEAAYAAYKARNDDPYGGAVVVYTERWADLMEARMAQGQRIADMAKATSYEANTDGITGFMYGCAAKALAKFWEHGEALRLWHNLDCQIGNEGERANAKGGILNPAILEMSPKPPAAA
jgi:hypothetical protein